MAVCLASLFIQIALQYSAAPVYCQTQEEMDGATKILGRPQTKTSALSFWAGVAEGKKYYAKAADYYANMEKLYELDFGPFNGRVAWAMAKRANCLSLKGDDLEAIAVATKCQGVIRSCIGTATGSSKEYLIEAQKTLNALPSRSRVDEVASNADLPVYQVEAQRGLDALRGDRLNEAISHMTEALRMAPKDCGTRVLLLNSICSAELNIGKLNSAFAHASEALKIAKEEPNKVNSFDLAGSYRNLGAIFLKQKKLDQSESMLSDSARVLTKMEPTNPRQRILWLMEMAQQRSVRSNLLKAQGRKKEADSEIAKMKVELTEHEKLMRELRAGEQ
jgi:tetratricopeptide (TPR) repeat protein